jgi:non-heme Fe2+,alpha-ketoglutarate-dependent halogenase
MRFLPGSHTQVFDHYDTFAANNMLTRGQDVAVDEDEAKIVHAELEPGQMSLHHGRLLHASGPNQSFDRRVGIAIRYVSPETRMARPGARIGASLVRGEDRYGHFDLVKAPTEEFGESAMRNWRRLRATQKSILYAGVERIAS